MQTLNRILFLLPLSLGVFFSAQAQTAVPTPASAVKLGLGVDYSRGDYGFVEDTEVLSTSLNLSYESRQWLLRAAIPYITVKGPASVVSGSGGSVFAAPARPTRSYEGGIGDVVTSATFHAKPSADQLNVDLTGRVKFGTADDAKGLGTGKTDFYLQADLYQRFGNLIPFATVGYRILGDPATYTLKEGPYSSIGSSFRVSDATLLGVAVDWRSRIVQGGEDAWDGTVFISHTPNDRWNVIGYVLRGFTKASADVGIGSLVSYRF